MILLIPSGFLFLCNGLMVLGCFLLFCIQRFELFSVCTSGFLFSAFILLFSIWVSVFMQRFDGFIGGVVGLLFSFSDFDCLGLFFEGIQ